MFRKREAIFASVALILIVAAVWMFLTRTPSVPQDGLTAGGAVPNWPELIAEAKTKSDPGICSNLRFDDPSRWQCFDSAYAAKARNEKDAGICEFVSTPESKVRCVDAVKFDLATASENPQGCSRIVDGEMRSECETLTTLAMIDSVAFSGSVSRSGSLCSKLSGQNKEYCLWRVSNDVWVDEMRSAVSGANPEKCSSISDAGIRSACMTLSTAAKTGEPSGCEKEMDSNLALQCRIVSDVVSQIRETESTKNGPGFELPSLPMATFKKKDSN